MLAQIRSNKFTLPAAFLYILLKCVSGMLTQMQVSTLSLFSLSSSRTSEQKRDCELRIIDGERYKRVVEAERQKMGKVSAKTIEQRCRAVLNDYRVQANTLKQQKKLLPFYPKEDFYTSK